ncbi:MULTISPECIES: flagellar protein export ATPase FliI [Bradyrhizobium]|uniref:Flagellum-specific ATP synthase n=1 Tax=Bradyrhizobium diazoefficiens (strain JCM 10833 / BCRC 13528 / IAM 13628 / NBRC 14792 / USDA 110) TaxID=224911 RepID=Q89T49_BRADU|nr:flagellar protein export ATPase FliI [Bradyrhizobium diazoefficiens]MBP1058966.1 flagellum-specific ATP synthase [Bradyrhizobium japonicum]AND87732.1 ATP synthase [Bradyrhizobium diazoefficiens USDA 110]AWO89248.1 flagellar protein export ATPase FliI [Bradyrhizobium diazoefficiens]PDT57782.1 flagellum-specific ATP synthase FliI [Bradyrhizobium diazoefficiens]QBP21030.1 flagellar protein export ATPase FliI [Bradyrhizobium diazoefficiens]
MKALAEQIGDIDGVNIYGRVVGVRGLMVEVAGPIHAMSVGARLVIETGANRSIPCEVIGFSGNNAVVMPFAGLDGVRRGCKAVIANAANQVRPSTAWLGRVVNALGEPIDGKGPLPQGSSPMPFRNTPPPAHSRKRVGSPLDLGVRAMNTFLTCCRGQRMGIFAGSGVGKSVLLSMLARNVDAAVSVIGLIGERGREVQEFLQDDLGEEGLARSVVVVATSDEPALMRRQAAYLTLAVAEYFRDEDKDVLCLMDSVTRFAMAQREIGLSAGEPPTAKGYTPTVFTELPKLLERAGPGLGEGAITAIFTVLVDGDDHNEPIADAVRGILDGHIVMQRSIAERGRYPAINILKSVSRTMPKSADPEFWPTIQKARQVMATYADMEELIRLGAYRAGSSPEVDEAIRLHEPLEGFLRQRKDENASLADGYRQLAQILGNLETER